MLTLYSILLSMMWIFSFTLTTTDGFVVRTNAVLPIRRKPITASLTTTTKTRRMMISSGFSFEDGEQILVSVQKPLGIVLEQNETDGKIVVVEVDPTKSAGQAGIQVGDILVAVQNASTISVDLEEVLDFIANKCPRVVNLRFQRISQNQ